LYIAGSLLVLAVAGYFIANAAVRRKVDAALRDLPAGISVRYRSLHTNILTGTLSMEGIEAAYRPDGIGGHRLSIGELTVSGFSVFNWWRYRRVRIAEIRANSVTAETDDVLFERDSSLGGLRMPKLDALIGRLDINGIKLSGMRHAKREFMLEGDLRLDSVTADSFRAVRLTASRASYSPPGADETIVVRQLKADSRQRSLRVDSLGIMPTLDAVAIGRLKGHQVDVVSGAVEDIEATGADIPGLLKRRLEAEEVRLERARIHIFRDRRLPLAAGDKPMPMAGLEQLPVDLRVGKLLLGTTRLEYEEFPKVGNETGTLVIRDFHGTMTPLVNRPRPGDPPDITVKTEGSLMGSGTVSATTRMPFHPGGMYVVDGAFHDLDVTRLNNPAENLGQLHLESGMLNSLAFHFDMGPERSTGKIVGEYHNLVADKLKEKNGQLKTDKFKSFALKKLIIPKNKDKSLPVRRRTGKVDYKRDRQRYFSYYLLHSLLVGVKKSFTLGFLLPG